MAKRRPRKANPRNTPEAPTCSCALLCDEVLVAQRAGKHTLQGIIGTIMVQSFPARLGGYVAYIRLSNVYGTQKVTISLEDDGETERVFEGVLTISGSTQPLDVYNVVESVPVFDLKRPGRYIFSVKSHGLTLASTPILIRGFLESGGVEEEGGGE